MKKESAFTLLAILSSVCLVASNLFEIKIFSVCGLPLTGGFLIFPISYIINDCITEVYGLAKAKFVIRSAFAMNAFVILAARLVIILPPAEYWDGQAHIEYMFNRDLWITLASMAAYLVGAHINARVMSFMKLRQGEKGFGWRAIASSLAGEGIDSLIFFPIAFFGVGIGNLLVMMGVQIVLKTLYEIIVLPLTYRMVLRLRKL